MAEIKDEIRLLALDAATGNLLWSQQLAMVESNITQDPVRRLAGVSPSYSDGVLICPTGAGCVVAVDLATRSLLWGYIYSHPGEATVSGPPRAGESDPDRLLQCQRSRAPLAGRHRHDCQRPGAAHAGRSRCALLPEPGRRQARLDAASRAASTITSPAYTRAWWCWSAATRSTPSSWKTAARPGAAAPSTCPPGPAVCGHGFYAGGQYFVPLSSGEVMAVDLESGKIVATAKPRRSARARQPGLLSRPGDFAGAGRSGTLLPGRCRAGRSGAPPGRQSRRRGRAHAPRRDVPGRRQVGRGRCRFPPGL